MARWALLVLSIILAASILFLGGLTTASLQDTATVGLSLRSGPPGPGPKPVLELIPEKLVLSGCKCRYNLQLTVRNIATGSQDVAKNVEVTFQVKMGAQAISRIVFDDGYIWKDFSKNYIWKAGDIGHSESATKGYTIYLKSNIWKCKPFYKRFKKIMLVMKVTREDNWPQENLGKEALVIIQRGKGPMSIAAEESDALH